MPNFNLFGKALEKKEKKIQFFCKENERKNFCQSRKNEKKRNKRTEVNLKIKF